MSKVYYEEHSKTAPSARYTILGFMAVIIVWFAFTVYRVIAEHVWLLPDFAIQIMIFFLLCKQGFSRYTYQVTATGIQIIEKGILGSKTWFFAYEDMDGISDYSRELFGRIKYRYKYRLASAMDNRKPMQLIYSLYPNNKVKHGRVILKASPEFYEALQEFIPQKACIPMDDVVFNTLVREEGYRLGYSYEEYLPIFLEAKEKATKEQDVEKERNQARAKQETEAGKEGEDS